MHGNTLYNCISKDKAQFHDRVSPRVSVSIFLESDTLCPSFLCLYSFALWRLQSSICIQYQYGNVHSGCNDECTCTYPGSILQNENKAIITVTNHRHPCWHVHQLIISVNQSVNKFKSPTEYGWYRQLSKHVPKNGWSSWYISNYFCHLSLSTYVRLCKWNWSHPLRTCRATVSIIPFGGRGFKN